MMILGMALLMERGDTNPLENHDGIARKET